LSNETVQVLVVWSLNIQVPAADVVDGLIVHHEATVGMLEGSMRGQDRVVWLNNGGGDLGSRVDAELQLALFAIVYRETFHQESSEARTSTSTKGMEDQESLQPGAVVCNPSNLVQNLVNEFLANSVMSTSVVVGRILLASDHLLGMEEATVGTGTDFVDDIGFEISVDGTRNVFALPWKMLAL
jgi:hypothetical protein